MPSNQVFSPPRGMSHKIKKTPRWNVVVNTPVSYRGETRVNNTPFPIWDIEYVFNYLKGSESNTGTDYQYLIGFYGQMMGPTQSFLVIDKYDSLVSPEGDSKSTAGFLAIGDGASTVFQLVRQIGAMNDIVQNPQPGTVVIYVNNQPLAPAAWTLNFAGTVTLSTPPAVGSIVSWSGSFYYRVRFVDQSLSTMEIIIRNVDGAPVWTCPSVKLVSVIL